MKMRETKRRKRLLSLFTTVILITSSAWTSFAYAEGEEIIQDVQNEIVQELSSEPQLIPVEETEEIIPQEDVEQDVGEEQIVEEEVVEEEPIIEEAAPIIEEAAQPAAEEEAVIEEVPAMAVMKAPEPAEDPNPNTGKEIEPSNPGVKPNQIPEVGDCKASYNMFESLSIGPNTELWKKDRNKETDINISININRYSTPYGDKIDFTATKSGKPVKLAAVYVKGGSEGGYLYDYTGIGGAASDTGLHAPKNQRNETYAGVSHLVFYYCPPVVEKEKEIKVEKVWKDKYGKTVDDNHKNFPYGTKNLPEVIVDIYDGETVVDTLELNNGNDWKGTSIKLVESKEYTLKERPITNIPAGFMLDVANSGEFTGGCDNDMPQKSGYKPGDIVKCSYVVVNKLVPVRYKDIEVTKVWKDQYGKTVDNKYKNFPYGTKNLPEVTVDIYDGETVVDTLKLNNNNGWEDKSIKLLGSKNYTLKERPITNIPEGLMLDSENSGEFTGGCDNDIKTAERCDCDIVKCSYVVVNKLIPIRYKDVTVEKVWKDEQGQIITDTAELPEVTVKIDFTDPAFEDKTLKLNYDNGWTDKVENILASRVYTIVEEAVTGLPEGYEIKKTDITGECIDPEMDRKIHEDRDIKCMHTVANTIGEEDEFEGRISGIKFNDLDKDGVHDENEPGLEGVTIYLYNVNPSEVSEAQPATSAVTDENGEFSFMVETEGTYYMKEKLPEGWVQSLPLTNLVSIALTEEDYMYPEDFEGASLYLFGNYQPDIAAATIEGYKFNDSDRDGVWDEVESGLQGWTITLWKYLGDMDESGTLTVADVQNMKTEVTDANGYYKFTELEDEATYYISENIGSMPYWYQTYPVTGPELSGTGRMHVIVEVEDGDVFKDVNFGNYYFRPDDGGGDDDDDDGDDGDDGGTTGGGGGGGTTVRITPGGGTEEPVVIEAFGPEEEVIVSLPVFSAEEPEEVVLTEAVMSPDANPQTSDAGIAMQMQMLGLSIAAMYVLRRKI